MAFGLLIDKDKNLLAIVCSQHTFKDVINSLKKDYQIGQVIVVADSGMLHQDNREAVKPYKFIMGERVKVLPKSVQESIWIQATTPRNGLPLIATKVSRFATKKSIRKIEELLP